MSLLLLDSPDPPRPTGRGAVEYAALLRSLLPPGRIWRAVGSVLDRLLLGSADEPARFDARAQDLLEEADPRTALELLPEWERLLDVAGAVYLEERRGRVTSRLIARQRFRPADFRAALAPLLGQDAADIDVRERTAAFAASIGDAREIYRFFIYRDPSLPGSYFVDSAQALVDSMKPSHTVGTVIESIAFKLGDPYSLLGRDLLGG